MVYHRSQPVKMQVIRVREGSCASVEKNSTTIHSRISKKVFELDAIRFTTGQRFNCILVDECHVPQIENQRKTSARPRLRGPLAF